MTDLDAALAAATSIPMPRTPADDPPDGIPAPVWAAVHAATRTPRDDRDPDGWIACGAYEIRFDDRRDR